VPNFEIPVSLYMTQSVHTAHEDDPLTRVQTRFGELGVSSLAVLSSDGELVGVISQTDLLRVGQRQAGSRSKALLLTLPEMKVSRRMTRDVVTVSPNDAISVAAKSMVDRRLHRVYVLDAGQLVGVLGTKDIMLAIRDKRVNYPVHEWMSSPVFSIRHNEPISLATERLGKAHVSGLVVVENEWPVGLFTQREALFARNEPRDLPVEMAMSAAMLTLDRDTPLHRAAAQAAALSVRRIVVTKGQRVEGILSGLDFARAVV
jgi:predicted transcriptional regulator